MLKKNHTGKELCEGDRCIGPRMILYTNIGTLFETTDMETSHEAFYGSEFCNFVLCSCPICLTHVQISNQLNLQRKKRKVFEKTQKKREIRAKQ